MKQGIFYNDKFWADYDHEGISKEEIDTKVNEFIDIINLSKVIINNENISIVLCTFTTRKDKPVILTALATDQYLVNYIDDDDQLKEDTISEITTELWNGNIFDKKEKELVASGVLSLNVKQDDVFVMKGELKSNNDKIHTIDMCVSEDLMGAGYSKIEIQDTAAILNGELGTLTYRQIKDLIKKHPNVRTIIFGDVPGSSNDDVNMHTGRLIRNAGFTTLALKNSEIHSGGVDLFCSGLKRIVNNGAQLGVHSWDDGDLTASEYPVDHPAHRFQLDYFKEMLGDKTGRDFYFFTINSAAADSIHVMKNEELISWNIATDIKNN